MDKRTNLPSRMAACVLLSINMIIMVICVTIFGCSLWMISSPITLSSAINATQSPTLRAVFVDGGASVQAAVGAATLAMFIFSIALMGVYGVITRSPFQLFMYSTLVFLLMLLECALLFYFSTNLIEKGVQQNGDWAHTTRIFFSCCEHNSTFTDSNQLPWSCCDGDIDNCTQHDAYKRDCQQTITNWLNRYQTSIYVCVVVFHLVLSSCSLVRRSDTSCSHT